MAISLTKDAAERVKSYLVSRGNGIGLRIGVKKTGCNGFAYVVNYADAVDDADNVFEDHGVKVVVDSESLALIDGTEVDFVKEGMNEAFRFNNLKRFVSGIPIFPVSVAVVRVLACKSAFQVCKIQLRIRCLTEFIQVKSKT